MFQMRLSGDLSDPLTAARTLSLFSFLILASASDLKSRTVPGELLLTGTLLALGLDLAGIGTGALEAAAPIWGLIPGIFYLLISLLSGAQVGRGDGAAILVTGLFAGLGGTVLIAAAAQLSCALAAVLLLASGRADRHTRIPFMPFLGGAALVLYLAGGLG